MDLSVHNPEITVIVRGLYEEPREDVPTKFQALLASIDSEMCSKVKINDLMSLKSRNEAPDIVKLSWKIWIRKTLYIKQNLI